MADFFSVAFIFIFFILGLIGWGCCIFFFLAFLGVGGVSLGGLFYFLFFKKDNDEFTEQAGEIQSNDNILPDFKEESKEDVEIPEIEKEIDMENEINSNVNENEGNGKSENKDYEEEKPEESPQMNGNEENGPNGDKEIENEVKNDSPSINIDPPPPPPRVSKKEVLQEVPLSNDLPPPPPPPPRRISPKKTESIDPSTSQQLPSKIVVKPHLPPRMRNLGEMKQRPYSVAFTGQQGNDLSGLKERLKSFDDGTGMSAAGGSRFSRRIDRSNAPVIRKNSIRGRGGRRRVQFNRTHTNNNSNLSSSSSTKRKIQHSTLPSFDFVNQVNSGVFEKILQQDDNNNSEHDSTEIKRKDDDGVELIAPTPIQGEKKVVFDPTNEEKQQEKEDKIEKKEQQQQQQQQQDDDDSIGRITRIVETTNNRRRRETERVKEKKDAHQSRLPRFSNRISDMMKKRHTIAPGSMGKGGDMFKSLNQMFTAKEEMPKRDSWVPRKIVLGEQLIESNVGIKVMDFSDFQIVERFNSSSDDKNCEVYKVQYSKGDGSFFAIKEFKFEKRFFSQKKEDLKFKNAVEDDHQDAIVPSIIAFRHKNLVRLEGISYKEPNLCLVLEYMKNGDLKSYMLKTIENSSNKLRFHDKIKILKEVADAMKFLHFEKDFILEELQTDRIFLGSNPINNPKISMFPLVKLYKNLYSSGKEKSEFYYETGSGSHYKAPEVVLAKKGVDKKAADVFAFAIIMWEVFFEDFDPFESIENCELQMALNPSLRPIFDDSLIRTEQQWYIDLMEQCWAADWEERPTFKEIFRIFQQKVKKILFSAFVETLDN